MSENDTMSVILGVDPNLYQVDYSAISLVERFHSLPRFSHSDDFSLLFSSDPEDAKDYSLGMIFLAVFIMSAFLVWGFAILLLKCLGQHRVGVFSGFPFKNEGWKTIAGRCTLFLSAFSIIIFAFVMVTKGIMTLQGTTDTIALTNQDVIKIHDEFLRLALNLQDVSRQAIPLRNQLVSTLRQDICPLNPGSDREAAVRIVGNHTLVDLKDLDNFMADHLQDINVALDQVQHATTQINTAVASVQFTGPQATLIMIPYFVLPAFLLVAVGMGVYDVYSELFYTIMTWLIMPLVVLMTIFAFVASGWTVLSVQGNSDFCYPTPEYNIQNIMEQYGLQSGQLYYDAIMFYTSQCSTEVIENPWTFMEVFHNQLIEAGSSLDRFLQLVINQTPEQFSQECGIDYSPVLELLTSLSVHVTILLNTSKRAMQLMSCPNIVPLYTNAVYNQLCQDNVAGAKWCFTCFLLMSFFGMLCIMFRGAYFPIDYFYFKDDDGDGEKSLYVTSESEGADGENGDEEHDLVVPVDDEETDYNNDSMVETEDYTVDKYGDERQT